MPEAVDPVPSAGRESRDLPPIAKDADDLLAIRKSVDDAASVSGTLWFSYVFVLFYIAVAAGAVTHQDLLLETPVKLPFLNIDLPLLAFFFLAPILFLIVHAYTLVHFVLLGRKARRFHEELYAQLPGGDGTRNAAIREGLRRQLPSNVFVQFLAGPSDIRDSLFGFLLKLIAWTTLVVGPVLLFLLLQIQFLPYHDKLITWVCRGALALDLLLIWFLWRKVIGGRDDLQGWHGTRAWRWLKAGVGALLSVLVVLLSWTVATFPGEQLDEHQIFGQKVMPNWDRRDADSEEPKQERLRSPLDACGRREEKFHDKLSFHDWLFAGRVDPITRRRVSWSSNTLVLPGFHILEAKKIDEPQKVAWKDQIVDLRGRNLEHAIMCGATLGKADLTGAHLQGALLNQVQAKGARFDSAQLRGASLEFALLKGASLNWAQLQGASLEFARLQGALLRRAELQGASLNWAQLQGASLDGARLQGASLNRAQLQGASLDGARLQGASLNRAQLQGASLNQTQLQGASLRSAGLQGILLESAFVWRTDWKNANLTTFYASELEWGPKHQVLFADRADEWTPAGYGSLREEIKGIVPEASRAAALRRVEILDCAKADPQLASCDPEVGPDSDASKKLDCELRDQACARIDPKTYYKEVASVFGELICAPGENGIFILRGIMNAVRLDDAGRDEPALAARILSEGCPVSKTLTDEEKTDLHEIAKKTAPAGKAWDK